MGVGKVYSFSAMRLKNCRKVLHIARIAESIVLQQIEN
jgi:hypothetical protein